MLLTWGLEVPGVHLHISKVSDRVWHDRLIFKQRQNGICGEMINILEEFLCDRNGQFFDGQCSPSADIRADVPHGSILGPLLFSIYNDLSNYIRSKCKAFAKTHIRFL